MEEAWNATESPANDAGEPGALGKGHAAGRLEAGRRPRCSLTPTEETTGH